MNSPNSSSMTTPSNMPRPKRTATSTSSRSKSTGAVPDLSDKVTSGNAADRLWQSRHEPACRERRRHADHEFAFARLRPQGLHPARDAVECLAEMFRGQVTLVGEFQPASGALEQRHAEELLEAANLVAHGGRRHVQLARRLGEAERTRGSLESTQ